MCATYGVVVFVSSIGLYLRMFKDDVSLAILCDLFWIVFLGTLSKDVGDLQRIGVESPGAEGVSAKKIPPVTSWKKENSSGCGYGSVDGQNPAPPGMVKTL